MCNRRKWIVEENLHCPEARSLCGAAQPGRAALQRAALFRSHHRGLALAVKTKARTFFLFLLWAGYSTDFLLELSGCVWTYLLAERCVLLQYEVRAKLGHLSFLGTQKWSWVKLKKKETQKIPWIFPADLMYHHPRAPGYFKTSHYFKHVFFCSLVEDLPFLSLGRCTNEADMQAPEELFFTL